MPKLALGGEAPNPGVELASAVANEKVRPAVERGLALLEREGVIWYEEKGCLSCHHTPFQVWTHLEARRRGLAIETRKLDEWVAWCVELAEPKGGYDVLAELMLFLPKDFIPLGDARKKLEGLAAQILSQQKADGSWQASGQFRGEQWPAEEADAACTMLMLQALHTPWADAGQTRTARERALNWLEQHPVPTPQATASYSMRLRLALNAGIGEKEVLCRNLISLQNADGGWSWKVGAEGSDPITTGEVLYILNDAGLDRATMEPVQARAVAWLLERQREDGGWYQDHKRISKKIRKEENPKVDGIYSYWATAWATLGLLGTLPVVEVNLSAGGDPAGSTAIP